MSTCYSTCSICGEEIGSAHEMYVITEFDDYYKEVAHPECWFNPVPPVADWKMLYRLAKENSREPTTQGQSRIL